MEHLRKSEFPPIQEKTNKYTFFRETKTTKKNKIVKMEKRKSNYIDFRHLFCMTVSVCVCMCVYILIVLMISFYFKEKIYKK